MITSLLFIGYGVSLHSYARFSAAYPANPYRTQLNLEI
jgi:hypothetical protein